MLAPGQVAAHHHGDGAGGAAAVPQVVNPARVSTTNDFNPRNDNDEEPTPDHPGRRQPAVSAGRPRRRQVLARTGTEAKPQAGLGALLVLFGAALVLATRRRNEVLPGVT